MIQDAQTIEQRHRSFVKTVCKNQIIYGLKDKEGFAMSTSNHYENESGESVGLICLWSEEARAKILAKEEWADYKPEKIALNNFIENWCLGMHDDGLYIGTNFDQNLFGFEIGPLELGIELINEIKKEKYNIQLHSFKNINQLETAIKQAQKG